MVVFNSSMLAQWNALAGYDIMRPGFGRFNALMDAFNAEHPEADRPVDGFVFLHGFVAGLRYNHNLGALELTYGRNLTRNRGTDYDYDFGNGGTPVPVETSLFINTSLSSWALTIEFGKSLIVGGSVNYNTLRHRVAYSSPSDNLRTFRSRQHHWGNRIFIGAHLTNTRTISFTFRPYYQWYWSAFDLSGLRDELLSDTGACMPCREQPHSFGISLIINNGPQG